jgi:hypothetical protein
VDEETGAPLTHARVATSVVQADSLGGIRQTLAPDRPGSYHVTIRTPGYRA